MPKHNCLFIFLFHIVFGRQLLHLWTSERHMQQMHRILNSWPVLHSEKLYYTHQCINIYGFIQERPPQRRPQSRDTGPSNLVSWNVRAEHYSLPQIRGISGKYFSHYSMKPYAARTHSNEYTEHTFHGEIRKYHHLLVEKISDLELWVLQKYISVLSVSSTNWYLYNVSTDIELE